MTGARLVGILVTFRRHDGLRAVLDGLAAQTRRVDHLVVVDNAPSAASSAIVAAYSSRGFSVDYLPTSTNLGSQGGPAYGMRHVVPRLGDDDWVVLFDDDQPPDRDDLLESLFDFAERMRAQDPVTGLVGAVGARFDWSTGRTLRPSDAELVGPVAVDYIGSGHLPLYLVRGLREVGYLPAEFFFGFGELELGLRLRRAGFSVYADGLMTARFRRRWGSWGRSVPQATRALVGRPSWRQYYGMRNLVWILRRYGHGRTAARVAFLSGLAKPLANVPRHPRLSWLHLTLNARAVSDAYRGRLGLRVQPDLSKYPS